MVIMLVGVNDMMMRLAGDTDHRPPSEVGEQYETQLLGEDFAIHPEGDAARPFYERTELWRSLRRARDAHQRWEKSPARTMRGASMPPRSRRHRREATAIRDELPDLTSAFTEYEESLDAIVDLTEKFGVRLVLMTQPSMWSLDLPEHLAELLWLGGVGDLQREASREYYSIPALAAAMDAYNDTLLEVCERRWLTSMADLYGPGIRFAKRRYGLLRRRSLQ